MKRKNFEKRKRETAIALVVALLLGCAHIGTDARAAEKAGEPAATAETATGAGIGEEPATETSSGAGIGEEPATDVATGAGTGEEPATETSSGTGIEAEPGAGADATAGPSTGPATSAEPATEPTTEPTANPTTGPAASAEPASGPAIDVEAYRLDAPTVTAQGGSKRVRLKWNAIADAEGYSVYSRAAGEDAYLLAKTVSGSAAECVCKSLEQGKEYSFIVSAFRTVEGIMVEGHFSAEVSASTAVVAKTSSAALLYSTKAKFKKSPAYVKFKTIQNSMNYNKSFAIPGMKLTNAGGFANTSMMPQGICLAEDYLLITAYDKNGVDKSVIYIVNKSTKAYVATLVLPSKAKVGGIAYDGKNIWVSKGTAVGYFPYNVISTAAASGAKYTALSSYSGVCSVDTTAGFIGYYDGVLWVGKTDNKAKSSMYGYRVEYADGMAALAKTYTMTIPSKTQGITFKKNGALILSRSYRAADTKDGYVSSIKRYMPSYGTPDASGKILKNAVKKTTKMPPLVEGVARYGNYTYAVFSSCRYKSCKYPVDRVIALETSEL